MKREHERDLELQRPPLESTIRDVPGLTEELHTALASEKVLYWIRVLGDGEAE